MAVFRLTKSEVCEQSEQFLYVFASDEFISYLGSKAARIIKGKRANQNKILIQSATYNGDTWENYTSAIREAFYNTYGMYPAQALVKLALGEEVAGKNWKKGIYGVSGTPTQVFSQNQGVSVDPNTGKILIDGKEPSGKQKRTIGGKNYPNGTKSYTYKTGTVTYTSLYDGNSRKYIAYQYVDAATNTMQAADGTIRSKSDSADIWMTVEGWIDKIIQWIISFFGGGENVDQISADNTVMSQDDGFTTQEAGLGTVGMVLLASVAAGTLLMGGSKKKDKK